MLHDDWGITFNANGTGYYFWGHEADDMHFYWRAAGDGAIRTMWAGIGLGDWDYQFSELIYFSIDGNTLTTSEHAGLMETHQRLN